MGRFIAVQQGGAFVHSDDGVTWTAAQYGVPFQSFWDNIAFGNGRFVISGGQGAGAAVGGWFYSADGINWHNSATTTGDAPNFISVVFDGEKFVGLADYSGLMNPVIDKIWTSPDGNIWTQIGSVNIGSGEGATNLGFDGTNYLFVTNGGKIFTSTDLVTWTLRTTISSFFEGVAAYWNGSLWMVISDGATATSPDTITWTTHGVIAANDVFTSLTFSAVYGGWVAGMNFSNGIDPPAIYHSGDNGATWTVLFTVPANNVVNNGLLIQGNNLYVFDQSGVISRSVNGGPMTAVFAGDPGNKYRAVIFAEPASPPAFIQVNPSNLSVVILPKF
jgi:hypothetical protein